MRQAVPNFGINSPPVWLHLPVHNPTAEPMPLQLQVGTPWLDRIQVQVRQNGVPVAQWEAGDALPGAPHLQPTQGFTFRHAFAPGSSDIYIRAATPDPLVLPVRLLTQDQAEADALWRHYGYGLLYGFLAALIAYNAVLAIGLRERSYLYYSLYLSCFILLNLTYTGHGQAWWWSGQPEFQRYVILVMMSLYSCAGLLFARRFLDLPRHAPRLARAMQGFAGVGLLLQCLFVLAGWQAAAVWEAFIFLVTFSLLMVWLGFFSLSRRLLGSRYFLAAALTGMAGAGVTAFAVAGWLPFTPFTYHCAEVGVLVEAILLALALSHQVRHHKDARQAAELLARIDPLTGLHNRRAFFELAGWAWDEARHNQQPLALIMLDIDHFKPINDQYGHGVGDAALVRLAQLLTYSCRDGDLLARWGGEEFIILLPHTNLEQAAVLAERIRASVAASPLTQQTPPVQLTVSLGVAQLQQQDRLEELVRQADACLYAAKGQGRNRVVAQPLNSSDLLTHCT